MAKKTYDVEMFMSGSQTDSSGTVKVWTKDDLDNIAKKYNESEHDAPVVVGHPKHNSPAFGMIQSAKRVGNKLMGTLGNMSDGFVEAWKDGAYPKRSISMYGDGTIRHIGFLGGMPPAVKGLADYQFSEAPDAQEEIIHEFEDNFEYMEWEEAGLFRQLGRVLQNIREDMIDKRSKKVADEIIPSHIVDDLKSTEATPIQTDSFSEPNGKEGAPMTPEEKARLETAETRVTELEGEKLTFSESITGKDKEIATLTATIADGIAQTTKEGFESFCDGLIGEGKMKPADKDGNVDQLTLAHGADSVKEFAEGDEEKKGAVAFMKASLSGAPKIVVFNETEEDGEEGSEKDPNAIAEKAQNYMEDQRKEGKTISFSQAVGAVTSSGKAKK